MKLIESYRAILFLECLVQAVVLSEDVVGASTTKSTTTETTRKLRGKPVVHTRKVYWQQDPLRKDERHQHENLVDPNVHQQPRTVRMRGTGRNGQTREFEIDINTLQAIGKEQQEHHTGIIDNDRNHEVWVDSQLKSQEQVHPRQNDHFEGHETVKHHHYQHEEHFYQQTNYQNDYQHGDENLLDAGQLEQEPIQKQQNNKKSKNGKYTLPTGLDDQYNQTLFEELHRAPFSIYEQAFGHPVEGRDSFPVFIVPEWKDSTGIFSGFSRTATPLVFENMQFLLKWDDITGASSGAHKELIQFMDENNFHSSLIIGKAFGKETNTAFLGLMVSYYQSNQKNILVPFATLDNFFHDTSEQHLLSETTRNLEFEALHEMLDRERMNNSTNAFFHPKLEISHERKKQLEELEAAHFRRLFQLLIRRSFLFSFGYADCLKTEPHALRECLDDTFSIVVRMETTVRGALDEQLVEELAEISESLHSKVSEVCVSISGIGGAVYGAGSCSNLAEAGAFVIHAGSSLL